MVAPLLVLVVLGISDLGRAFYYATAITNAAREGARHGTYFDPGTSSNPYDTQSGVFAAVQAEANYVSLSQLSAPGTACPSGPPYTSNYPTTANSGNVIVCFNGNWSTTPATAGQYVKVIVLYNYQPITPLLGKFIGSSTLHLEGTAVMAVQGLS
jgi:Flp pilus assembly protein TadG